MPVTDLDRSVEFYRRVLGYRPTLRMNLAGREIEKSLALPPGATGRSVFMQGPSQLGQIEMIEWSGGPAPGARPGGMKDLGGFLMSFEIEDGDTIEDQYRRARDAGAECLAEPLTVELENYGVIRSFVCRDPDGYLLEFLDLPTRAEISAYRSEHAEDA